MLPVGSLLCRATHSDEECKQGPIVGPYVILCYECRWYSRPYNTEPPLHCLGPYSKYLVPGRYVGPIGDGGAKGYLHVNYQVYVTSTWLFISIFTSKQPNNASSFPGLCLLFCHLLTTAQSLAAFVASVSFFATIQWLHNHWQLSWPLSPLFFTTAWLLAALLAYVSSFLPPFDDCTIVGSSPGLCLLFFALFQWLHGCQQLSRPLSLLFFSPFNDCMFIGSFLAFVSSCLPPFDDPLSWLLLF